MNASEKAAEKRRRASEGAANVAAHKLRVSAQRAIFRRAAPGQAKTDLRIAMLERAWWLLDAGECEAADALLEFLPESQADRLLSEFFETRNEFNPALYLEML